MDRIDLHEFSEETIITEKIKISKKKISNPKFISYLFRCLDEGKHQHMLRYVGFDKTEFQVIYIDKKNRKHWRKEDESLFKDLDNHLGNVFKRNRLKDDCKSRFRSNLSKCFGKYIEEVDKIEEKCKRIVRYRILERPRVPVEKTIKVGEKSEGKKLIKKMEIDNEDNSKFSLENLKNVDISMDFDINMEIDNEDNSKFSLENLKNVDISIDYNINGTSSNLSEDCKSTFVHLTSYPQIESNPFLENCDNIQHAKSCDNVQQADINTACDNTGELVDTCHYLCLSVNLHVYPKNSVASVGDDNEKIDKANLTWGENVYFENFVANVDDDSEKIDKANNTWGENVCPKDFVANVDDDNIFWENDDQLKNDIGKYLKGEDPYLSNPSDWMNKPLNTSSNYYRNKDDHDWLSLFQEFKDESQTE